MTFVQNIHNSLQTGRKNNTGEEHVTVLLNQSAIIMKENVKGDKDRESFSCKLW